MITERIQWLIEQMGAEVTGKAVENLAKSLKTSNDAAKQHSNELRGAARMNEVMERASVRSRMALAGLSTQFTATSKAAAAASQSGLGFGQMAQRGSIVLGTFTTALSSVAPGLNGMGASISRASGFIGNLSHILTGAGVGSRAGIYGAIAGGVVGAIGLLGGAFKSAAQEAEDSRKAMEDWAAEVKAAGEVAAEVARNSPLGVARRVEEERRRENLERQRNTMQGFFDSSSGASPIGYGTGYDLGVDDDGNPFASKEAQREYLDRKAKEAGRERAKRSGGKAIPFVNYGDPYRDSDAAGGGFDRRPLDRAMEVSRRREAMLGRLSFDDEAAALAGVPVTTDLNEEFARENAERARSIADPALDAHNQELALYEEKAATAEEYYGTLRSSAMETYGAISGAIASTLSAAIVGEKVSTNQVLKGIGRQSANMGLLNLLQAPVSFFWNPAKAAAEVAAGTAQIALGAALGAAAGSSGTAGGSGGAGRGSFAGPDAPILGTPSRDTGAGGGSGGTTIIQMNVSGMIVPTAHEGQLGRLAEAEARRQGR